MATDKVPAREAAERLGMSPQGVYSAFKAGRLAGEYRTSGDALRGGSLWIAVDEIERFAAAPRTRGRPRRVEAAAKIEQAKRRESIVETRGLAFPPGTEPGLIRDTLDELCQTVETYSAVTLTSDLVERGRLSQNGDPVGLVVAIIEELGSAGLVKYRLRRSWSDIPLKIRVTPKGYEVAGYTTPHAQVGSRPTRHMPLRPQEAMEWRLLASITWGGPIERSSLADHLIAYPDHRSIHPSVWECGPNRVASGDEAMAAATHADHARLVAQAVDAIINNGLDPTQVRIQQHLQISAETGSRWVREAQGYGFIEPNGEVRRIGTVYRLTTIGERSVEQGDPIGETTRQVILNEIRQRGKVATSKDLVRYIGQVDARWKSLGLHSLQHQLRSMKVAGLIRFDDKVMGNVREIRNIELAKGVEAYGARIEKVEGLTMIPTEVPDAVFASDLTGQTIDWSASETTMSASEPAPDRLGQAWPVLDRLRERERESATRQARAGAYMAAAEALAGIDDEESERLFKTAGLVAEEARLSECEAEYLRWVKEHE